MFDLTQKKLDWIALTMIPGLGNIISKKLLERFGSPENIFKAPISELITVEGLHKTIAKRIAKKEFSTDPSEELKRVEQFGAGIITYSDRSYPSMLKEIHDPPILFYMKGKGIPRSLPLVALVGSRNPSHYGLKIAEEMGQALAKRGVGIVSGMARGIDSAAHWGCIKGRGFTIAVLGTGVDVAYPSSNKKLRGRITESGTVISEFPMGTSPEPRNFPRRNRIISGLSRGVVIVEATKKSGSLITASSGLDQGREVFAVPGNIYSLKSTGCHFLIKQGAKLVENPDDILEELGLTYDNSFKSDNMNDPPRLPMEASEKHIYDMIGDYPTHIDQIAKSGQLEPAEASSILMRMELKGVIKQLPGKMFVRECQTTMS